MSTIEKLQSNLLKKSVSHDAAFWLVKAINDFRYKSNDELTEFTSSKIIEFIEQEAFEDLADKSAIEIFNTIQECRSIINMTITNIESS